MKADLAVFGGMTVGSLLVHAALVWGLEAKPDAVPRRSRTLEMTMVKPVKPPPPTEPPPPPPPAPKSSRPVAKKAAAPSAAPPPAAAAPPLRPVLGLTLSGVGAPGVGGIAVPVGNTLTQRPVEKAQAEVAPRVVPSHELGSLPKRQGPCEAAYPDAARELGIAGKVRLQLDIDALGHVGRVAVLDGPGHGLEEAAVAALRACRFSPATLGGTAVATSITYTYTFVIDG
ncbi:MAG: TonB family protein [Myxococcaceae bacterium]|nr:TonB family protein [Myxococcaceae bacterium]